ncbi:hypothetical protein [Streptomyces sp. b62]|nr:hypothetical protein [Streptomyces sp. b62]
MFGVRAGGGAVVLAEFAQDVRLGVFGAVCARGGEPQHGVGRK